MASPLKKGLRKGTRPKGFWLSVTPMASNPTEMMIIMYDMHDNDWKLMCVKAIENNVIMVVKRLMHILFNYRPLFLRIFSIHIFDTEYLHIV